MQNEWISVEDRLPEEDTRVLVHLNTKPMVYDTDRRLNGKWVRWNSNVTHWMPIPELPKGEKICRMN